MYAWIWRRLPGGIAAKLLSAIVLVAALVALLFLLVFPLVGPKLPFSHPTVHGRAAGAASVRTVPGSRARSSEAPQEGNGAQND
jgi:hypothetical protein